MPRQAGYRPYSVKGDPPEPHDCVQGGWMHEQSQQMDERFRRAMLKSSSETRRSATANGG
jgi:hypothetical protein